MKNWDDIVAGGSIPQEYLDATGHTEKRQMAFNMYKEMPLEEADKQGQAINASLRTARNKAGRQGEPEDTPEYMKNEWGWSDKSLEDASHFYHTAPKHARPHIEINGIRANLTTTIGDPREMKQRYGVFGSMPANGPSVGYGLQPSHPDADGIKRADIYQARIPVSDVRIDPEGYPYTERSLKPHEFDRVGHALQHPDGKVEVHTGKEEECDSCK